MTGTLNTGECPSRAPDLYSSDIGSAARLAASAFYAPTPKLSQQPSRSVVSTGMYGSYSCAPVSTPTLIEIPNTAHEESSYCRMDQALALALSASLRPWKAAPASGLRAARQICSTCSSVTLASLAPSTKARLMLTMRACTFCPCACRLL